MDIWGKYGYLKALESNVKSLEERIHTRMLSLEEDKDFNGGSSRHFSCGCDKILNKINLRKQGSIPALLQLGHTVCGFPCGGQGLRTRCTCSQETKVKVGACLESQSPGLVH